MIKVVALDLGNVVLEIDIETHLRSIGITEEWKTLSHWKAHWDFETGKMATNDFYQAVRERFSLRQNDQEIESAWLKIIVGFLPGIPELLKDIRTHVKLVALTNTNPPHVELFKKMPEFQSFHKIFASNEVGHRKPDREIFEAVAREMKVQPGEILFFDDLPENIEAAKTAGLNAVHCYRSTELIREKLREFGVLSK
jgi:HAD superfamily hydrolase (TIGR01509 family)